MNEILNTILKDSFTLAQLKHRIRVLKVYLESALFGGQNPKLITSDFSWLSALGQPLMTQFTKDNLYQKFQEMEEVVAKLPILIIYLPFETTDAANLQIGSYLRKAYNRIILLDPKLDPKLLAGCALVWNGVYKDYSLRIKIEERKGEILESFKKFL